MTVKIRNRERCDYFHSLVPLTWRTSDWLTMVISGTLSSLSFLLLEGAAAATANRIKMKNYSSKILKGLMVNHVHRQHKCRVCFLPASCRLCVMSNRTDVYDRLQTSSYSWRRESRIFLLSWCLSGWPSFCITAVAFHSFSASYALRYQATAFAASNFSSFMGWWYVCRFRCCKIFMGRQTIFS